MNKGFLISLANNTCSDKMVVTVVISEHRHGGKKNLRVALQAHIDN
jgi:hypothetical protein